MSDHGYEKAIVVLSHNDADHFDGIPYLIENDLVSKAVSYTHLRPIIIQDTLIITLL